MVWGFVAELKKVIDQRVIVYDLDEAEPESWLNLKNVMGVCQDACETLLKNTTEKRDRDYINKEIDFIKHAQKKWKEEYKTW
jgi:hypothetical protein